MLSFGCDHGVKFLKIGHNTGLEFGFLVVVVFFLPCYCITLCLQKKSPGTISLRKTLIANRVIHIGHLA